MTERPHWISLVHRYLGLLRYLSWRSRLTAISQLMESKTSRRNRVETALSKPPARLVFVCHGNIMRSAFAAAFLQQQHPANAYRIVGAGTHAKDGRAAQESALRVASELGVPLADHRAQSLSSAELTDNDIVVCMDRANVANTIAASPVSGHNVFLIGDIMPQLNATEVEIRDPYAKGDVATREAFDLVQTYASEWYRRVEIQWSLPI